VFLLRGLAALVVLLGGTGLSLGAASPAQASNVMQGVYDYRLDTGSTGTLTIYPSCVPVVGDLRVPLYLPVGCRLHVQSSGDLAGGDAVQTNGIWAFSTTRAEGMKCPDGSMAPTLEYVSFDDVTMTGTRRVSQNGECGLQPGIFTTPFTLTFKNPLPIPVQQYPLYCEPGGLRRCF
jgi:hypothetical protein